MLSDVVESTRRRQNRRPRRQRRKVRASRPNGHGGERLIEAMRDGAPVVAIDHELTRSSFDAPPAIMVGFCSALTPRWSYRRTARVLGLTV